MILVGDRTHRAVKLLNLWARSVLRVTNAITTVDPSTLIAQAISLVDASKVAG